MAFGTCTWTGTVPSYTFPPNGRPKPELRQRNRKSFFLIGSLCYRERDEPVVYIIPGTDAPVSNSWRELTIGQDRVIVPPNPTPAGKTDLASVPWPLWWLVASYGNHTRAALLHDALYVETRKPLVPRKTADRLLLSALRERGEKSGAYRHWLMWAAVSAFGTMGHFRGLLFSAHVLAVWMLAVAGLSWAWARALWDIAWPLGRDTAGLVLAAAITLVVLGFVWRYSVDRRGGWIVATAWIASPIAVGLLESRRQWRSLGDLSLESSWTFVSGISPFVLLTASAVLLIVGLLIWGSAVDRSLRWWLWPTALLGLPIALLPCLLILAAVGIIWLIDAGAAVAAAARGERPADDLDDDEKEAAPSRIGPIVIPSPTPTRIPGPRLWELAAGRVGRGAADRAGQ